jgi:nitrite reductase/ring-hydroxylating ferredoxin subunit
MKQVSRREVIKTIAWGAAISCAARKSWADPLLSQLQFAGDFSGGVLRVDINDFPALSQSGGSVRLGTFPIGPDRKSDAWLKPILITRGEAEEFNVLSAVCTHEGCILPMPDQEERVIICTQDGCGHGSQFELDGTVRRGPANSTLPRYQFQRDGTILNISVPELFYDVTVDRATGLRIQIKFVAFYQTSYEIYFRPSLNGTSQRVSFSLTPEGPANLQAVDGNFNSEYVTLYLDKPATFGFFQVVVKTGQV